MNPPTGIVRAGHTHLYPGARLQGRAARPRAGRTLRIEFIDMGSAPAHVESVEGDEMTIAVGAYRTARGTRVDAKRWKVERLDGGEWRVRQRLPAPG